MGLSAGQQPCRAWPGCFSESSALKGRLVDMPGDSSSPHLLSGLPRGQERKGTSEEPGDKALGEGRKETEAGHQEELSGSPKAIRLWVRVSVVGG